MLDRSSKPQWVAERRAADVQSPLLPLQVRGLTLEADGRRLLDDIRFDLSAGHRTIIMGPNGAGKSLLLRVLHGLVSPTTGSIRWGRGAGLNDRKRQAMVFQRPVLLRRSVAANLEFALRLSGAKGAELVDRRDSLLARVGLQGRHRQPARLLSGGEQQRLALARALATEPDILFLDEPTASLDPGSVRTIEDIVQATSAAGTKIVFVTHDLAQARRLADEVLFMHRGQVVEHAPAASFFHAPKSEMARAFMAGQLVL
ncbi:MAG: ATP-binding cassette domain-containing protein [Pseudomonadota bacterium]